MDLLFCNKLILPKVYPWDLIPFHQVLLFCWLAGWLAGWLSGWFGDSGNCIAIRSHYVCQGRLMILLPQPPKFWDYMYIQPCPLAYLKRFPNSQTTILWVLPDFQTEVAPHEPMATNQPSHKRRSWSVPSSQYWLLILSFHLLSLLRHDRQARFSHLPFFT